MTPPLRLPEGIAGPMGPELIPGVIDGLVTITSEPSGGVCLYVVADLGADGSAVHGHIELVLRPEHGELLGAALLGGRQSGPPPLKGWVPCCLGLRLKL